jgi:hypothetical protein
MDMSWNQQDSREFKLEFGIVHGSSNKKVYFAVSLRLMESGTLLAVWTVKDKVELIRTWSVIAIIVSYTAYDLRNTVISRCHSHTIQGAESESGVNVSLPSSFSNFLGSLYHVTDTAPRIGTPMNTTHVHCVCRTL